MSAPQERSSPAGGQQERAGGRPVHLVGSIPLADSESVFRAVAGTLGEHVSRIPDGETGPRTRWSSWTAPSYERTRGLELLPPPPGNYTPWQQVRLVIDPDELVLERLGFADAAIASYKVFERLRAEGAMPAHTRFQVCLPSPIAPMTVLIEEGSRAAVEPAHRRQLHAEIAEIVDAVPHELLTIQWDVCQDVGIWEGYYPAYFDDPQEGVVERLALCAEVIPEDVELGFHLCYGDYQHKHFMEPADLDTSTQIINRLSAAAARTIDYFHVPVPIERDDDAYFAPLAQLELTAGTELYVGLIHFADGLEGARRRLDAAGRYLGDFGVATECGFGRRPAETIAPLLQLHADVAALAR
jgi:methionine synthase II (cobalamin-independent)